MLAGHDAGNADPLGFRARSKAATYRLSRASRSIRGSASATNVALRLQLTGVHAETAIHGDEMRGPGGSVLDGASLRDPLRCSWRESKRVAGA